MSTGKRKKLNMADSTGNQTDTRKKSKKGGKVSQDDVDHDSAHWTDLGQPSDKGLTPVLMYNGPGISGSSKIAGFDLDYTLIRPKSGRKWPTGPKDWQFMNDEIKPKLQNIHHDGYKVVIFTNQRGIEKQHTNIKHFKTKCEDIISAIDIPIQVFVSTSESHYRKPSIVLWETMTENNENISVDLNESFYIGDAAGRPKAWSSGKPKDFSASDRMFAANVGIKFQTPEEYFLDESPTEFEWRSIDPKKHLDIKKIDAVEPKDKDLIIMVGPPACGKSAFYRNYLEKHGYVRVNQDTLKTQAKCLALASDSIKGGKSVVIDNTNPSSVTREAYIQVAKKNGYGVRCVVMDVPVELAKHLNYVRQNYTKSAVRRIPNVAYNMYKKNFTEPKKSEGIDEIFRLPFLPHFQDEDHKKLFLQWTDY
ncbi:uncharacterized protein F21D5.5-like [Antedon mediterranea]|uniref:uncharacterized protein F21D5.5-like n=1 Tax=Antedon mediterranea TaxID=105859 RepID=UPI003AF8AF16